MEWCQVGRSSWQEAPPWPRAIFLSASRFLPCQGQGVGSMSQEGLLGAGPPRSQRDGSLSAAGPLRSPPPPPYPTTAALTHTLARPLLSQLCSRPQRLQVSRLSSPGLSPPSSCHADWPRREEPVGRAQAWEGWRLQITPLPGGAVGAIFPPPFTVRSLVRSLGVGGSQPERGWEAPAAREPEEVRPLPPALLGTPPGRCLLGRTDLTHPPVPTQAGAEGAFPSSERALDGQNLERPRG